MPIGDFVDLVRRMRSAQVEYFRVRSQSCLVEAKRLERLVDTAVRNWEGDNNDGHLGGTYAGSGRCADVGGARGL